MHRSVHFVNKLFITNRSSSGCVILKHKNDWLQKFLVGNRRKMAGNANPTSIYDFKVKNDQGEDVSMEKYKGYVTIVVNVASKCGFTDKSYSQLQALYEKYGDKGLKIAAFPCNQFNGQEPGAVCEIKKNMGDKYHVTFDIYDKIDVNGSKTDPLFAYLKEKQGGILGNFIKWNFTKFLVDRKGQPTHRYAPTTTPNEMENDIVKALDQQ